MRLDDQWEILAALPYLAAGVGVAWFGLTLALRRAAKLRSARHRKSEEAARLAAGPSPWNDWLREINERTDKERLVQDRSNHKWRE